MPKKRKKQVETIKIEGLNPESIKEFAPKEETEEEDALWEEYFRGSPNLLKFPKTDIESINKEEIQDINNTKATTVTKAPSVTTTTNATAVTNDTTVIKPQKRKTKKQDYVTLDSTHTKSEQMVYSIMYRETITKGKTSEYFSLRKLMKITGIGSDKTVFNALKGLRNKVSIEMVEHGNYKPIGTLYRVFTPKEIFKLRDNNGIIVDINTKRIVRTAVTKATAVDNNTPPTTVKRTKVTTVENTEVNKTIPYIKEIKDINRDDSIKKIESSSLDDIFNHKNYIISLYEKYTENKWRVGDDKTYDGVKEILPDIIEAAILVSILRSKVKVNSFLYCERAIQEFKDNLVPGYLLYLRQKWEEIEEKAE